MKSLFLFLCGLCYGVIVVGHDIPLANFTLSQQENVLFLAIHIDRQDFEQAYTEQGKFICGEQEDKEGLMKDYLRTHLTIMINDKICPLQFHMIIQDAYHFELQLIGQLVQTNIQSIHVQNTCLVSEIAEQSNVVIAEIKDKVRGFRMTKDRTKIIINYE